MIPRYTYPDVVGESTPLTSTGCFMVDSPLYDKTLPRGPTMSLNPCPIDPVPLETARVARAAFPKGNRYITMRDELGVLYPPDLLADL